MSQTQTVIELTTQSPDGKSEPSHPPPEIGDVRNIALRKGPTAVIFTSVTAVTGISSLLSGLITIALPRIVHDIEIPASLQFW